MLFILGVYNSPMGAECFLKSWLWVLAFSSLDSPAPEEQMQTIGVIHSLTTD